MVRAGSRVRVRFEDGTKYRGTVKRVRREDGNPVALTIDYDDGTCETADFPDHDVEVMEDGVDESSEEEADDGHDSEEEEEDDEDEDEDEEDEDEDEGVPLLSVNKPTTAVWPFCCAISMAVRPLHFTVLSAPLASNTFTLSV